jgi:hypothetical protein
MNDAVELLFIDLSRNRLDADAAEIITISWPASSTPMTVYTQYASFD